MLFCQVGRAHSLREICGGLASVEGKLNHLGVGNAPARSTLSYANAHRPYALFEEVFGQLLERCRSLAAPKPFRFKNKLYSLDATVIDLCLSAFDWAKFRRPQGQHPRRPNDLPARQRQERQSAAALSPRGGVG